MQNKKRIFAILTIDGGGVRGVVPARILQEIEERTGKPIAALFDMVGGTSTGAIIGGGLVIPDTQDPTKPRFSAKEILSFYHDMAPRVFPEMRFKSIRKFSSGALYDPKPLEDILEKKFGNAKMRDMLTSFLVPATDIKNFKPVWITHLKGRKDASEEGWGSMLLRDALRATTTAPTFFPARYFETTPNEDMPGVKHRHALIDGGFFGGNTMRHLMAQAKKMAPPDAEIIVVHIGTGHIKNSVSPEEFNAMGPLGLMSKANGSILISLVSHMAVMDVENDTREELGDRLFRFDAIIDPEKNPNCPSTSLDDARPENLQRLEVLAQDIIKSRSHDLDRLCIILQQRSFAEEKYLESHAALKTLSAKMAAAKTVSSLMGTYLKIVRSDTATAKKPADVEISALFSKLNDSHKAEIEIVYRVLLDQKRRQSKILNTIKEVGEDISRITKEILIEPFKDPPPLPPGNDNAPSPKIPKQGNDAPKL